jgi:hypothetical protein
MFADKVFRLYDYQRQIGKSAMKNGLFSTIINKELHHDARMMLDDMFYMISTSRVIDPNSLTSVLRPQKRDPGLSELKDNIDRIINIAEQVVHYEPAAAAE